MAKILKRTVHLNGVKLDAGTELTDEQAARITNPKAYEDAADATGPDANALRPRTNIVRSETDPLAGQAGADADADELGDRAAVGAKLARGKAAKPAAG